MSSAGPGPWRAARAAVASTTSVATALTAHRLTGGPVDPAAAAALLTGALALSWTLTSSRVSLSQVLGLLVLCQAVVHIACAGSDPTVGGVAMIAAHSGATAFSAWLLTRAETWAWALAEALAIRPWQSLRAVAVPVVAAAVRVLHQIAVRSAPRDRSVPVRGPPVVA